ncbi:MAG TPA: patatin-like phospholipase family protein [Burkholderiales bacterium]|nr:patatin-like phospholipase family protein [Burkholderiales bacterium]
MSSRRTAIVFSGGIGLGAYQAGAYAALHEHETLRPDWLAGSSVGAVNAAVIAGSAPEERVDRLRELWSTADAWQELAPSQALAPGFDSWRHVRNWASVMRTRILGSPGHFQPRLLMQPFERFRSLYDLAPLRARIEKLVDFGRLNSREIRFAVVATDIETGDPVQFDTAKGDRITTDHLLASCGYLPEFAPVEIDGRMLGDGGLSANAPIEAVMLERDRDDCERVCFVLDLFARDGARPAGLEAALARKNDLIFGNQTYLRLEALRRESEIAAALSHARERLPADAKHDFQTTPARPRVRAVLYLSYRAPPEEAGPEKTFDLSRATVTDRWHAGELDMAEAVRRLGQMPGESAGMSLLPIRRPA